MAQPITAGNVQITGGGTGFTQVQATDLADALKYGSLPLDFQLLTENTVSAQLGHSSLDGGLLAGIIGLALVATYLFAYYRGLGLVAVSSLLLAGLLAYLSVVLLSQVGRERACLATESPGGIRVPERLIAFGVAGMLVDLAPQDGTEFARAELSPGGLGGPEAAPRSGDVDARGRRARGRGGDGFGVVDGRQGGAERGEGVGVPFLKRGGEPAP